MPNGSLFKWEKVKGDAWVYGPSVLEERPMVCRVAPACNPRPKRPKFYRAEIGRPPDPFIGVDQDRDTVARAREDARHFIRSHYSYENLLCLYATRLEESHARERR